MLCNLSVKNFARYVSVPLLMLIFTFASIGISGSAQASKNATSLQAIANYQTAQRNPALSDEEKIKATIDAYFTLRYEGQKLVEAQDFSVLLENNTLDWVKKEKDKREIELYVASTFNLSYQSYQFSLKYDVIRVENNKATVKLRRGHAVVYAETAPEVSEMANLSHIITLIKRNGEWSIYQDDYEDEYTRLLKSATKSQIKEQIQKNYRGIPEPDAEMADDTQISQDASASDLTAYPYARGAATTYSWNNALTRGPIPGVVKNEYLAINGVPYPSTWEKRYTYETFNNGTTIEDVDCTNFVSQAIFAGTKYTSGDPSYFDPIPNDNNWYHKFSKTPKGSATWINTGMFYDYLTNITTSKRGPYGVKRGVSSFCNGLGNGDLIFMKIGQTWKHVVIIYTKSVTCLSPNNIFVNSHSPELRNEPLTNWSGYSWYGVRIQGYRK